MTEGGLVYFDNVPVLDSDVLPKLYQLHEANKDVKVSLSAETLAMHGDVIGLLDKIRLAGITKIGYQIKAASVTGAPGTVPAPPGPPGAPPPPPKSPEFPRDQDLASNAARNDRMARARWLIRFFSAGESSANVCSNPCGWKTGSYPNPARPSRRTNDCSFDNALE